MDKNMLNDELAAKAPYLITTGENQCLFYHCEEKLCLRERENQAWEDPQVILPHVDRFAAALDANFRLHLIVFTRGDLQHLTGLEDKKNRLMEQLIFREEGRSCSNLLLTGDAKGGLHLLYSASASDPDSNRWWLFHHYFDSHRWLEPRVVDFGGSSTGNPGCLTADLSGNLHLIYRIEEGEHTRLYYRHFILSSLTWDRALPVSAYGQPCLPRLIVDRQQNLHLIWGSQQDHQDCRYYVNYRKLSAGGWPSGGWGEIETISPPLNTPPFPLLNCRENKITAGWLSEKKEFRQFELTGEGWQEQISSQEASDYLLLRSCSPMDWETPPSTTWILGRGTFPDLELVPATAPPRPGWDPYFSQLDTYSKHLVRQASEQTGAKLQLERALEAKQKEMFWISQHSRKKIETLTGSLQQKDRALQELENKLQQTIDRLKQRTEQSQKRWAEEKKRYQLQATRLDKENRQLQQMLLEKENSIAKIEAQFQELKQGVSRVQEENQILRHRLEQPPPGIKERLGRLFQRRI